MSQLLIAQYPSNHLDHELDGRPLLNLANRGLLVSAVVLLLTILVCYPYADRFSLGVQILGHAAMILSTVMFKLAYLLRCVAQQALHLTVG